MKLEATLSSYPGEHVSVRALPNSYVDAGVSGDLAGLELAIEAERGLRVSEGHPRSNTEDPVLSIATDPDTLLRIAMTILDKLGTPAFTEPEWRTIASALKAYHADNLRPLAERIERAYDRTPA